MKWFLIAIMTLLVSMTIYGAMAYDMSCNIRTTACSSGETVLLYFYNLSANYSNAHVQSIHAGGTNYPNVVCCNSTIQPIGNLTNGTAFIYMAPSVDTTDLELSFTFNTDAGVATDLSGNSRTGTLVNPVWTEYGYDWGAYKFTKTEYISAADFADISGDVGLSAFAWIYPKDDSTSDWGIISKDNSTTRDWFITRYGYNTHVRLYNSTGGYCELTTNDDAVDSNDWSYVGFTWEKTAKNMTIYEYTPNGLFVKGKLCPNIDSLQNSANLVLIGTYSAKAAIDGFNGTIDEVRIWSKTLSAAEVAGEYGFSYLSNAHAQEGGRTGLTTLYNYAAYISSAQPQPYCDLYATACPTNYTCLFSMWNRTNTHIGACTDGYDNLLCCDNREPHQWSTIPDNNIYFSTADPNPVTYLNAGTYISRNYSGPTFTASSVTSPYECWVSGNTIYLRNPTGAAGSGVCIVNSTESGYPVSTTGFTMTWTFATSSGGGGGGGGGAPSSYTDSDNDGYTDGEEITAGTNQNDPLSYPTTPPVDSDGDGFSDAAEFAAGFSPTDPESHPTATPVGNVTGVFGNANLRGFMMMVAVGFGILVLFWLLSFIIAWDDDRKKKKQQKEMR